TGDLAHVGSKYPADQLQTRLVWPAGLGGRGGARQQKVSVTLSSGERVSGTLKQIDDVNVSMWDGAANYRSWPRAEVKVELEDRLAGHRKLLAQYTDEDMHNLTAYLVTLK